MTRVKPYSVLALTAVLLTIYGSFNSANAEEKKSDFSFGTTSYLSYETEMHPDDGMINGAFKVNRSYLTMKKSVNDFLGFRITVDAHIDETGDMKARLKYVYADFKLGDFAFLTKTNIEFGLAHTPWLDFEEHINYYRMQGTMFMERSKLFNSADFGFTLGGLFGGEMDKEYKETVNSKYAGRYGSFALGFYNGAGYHAKEANENKTFQGRLTFRPIADIAPGLQVSYMGIFGLGNMAYGDLDSPDWNTNAFMLSYEHQYFALTGQYVMGKGNQKGDFSSYEIDAATSDTTGFKAWELNGMSVFAEVKPDANWRFIARYDSFDKDTDIDDNEEQRLILGVGYDFGHHNVLILDFDKTMYKKEGSVDRNMLKLTMQVNF